MRLLKTIAATLLLLNIGLTVWAQQDNVLGEVEDTVYYSKVMMIPLNPDLYLCDANNDLTRSNNMDYQTLRDYIRDKFDYHLGAELLPKIDIFSFIIEPSVDAEKDLASIYQSVSYKYEKPTIVEDPNETKFERAVKKAKEKLKDITQKPKENPVPTKEGEITAHQMLRADTAKYMNVKIPTVEMLYYFKDKYGTDLFAFVNQLEIKTLYASQQDIPLKRYTREVWVHYTILNSSGEHKFGGVIKAPFRSNSNDIDQIISGTFPDIAASIASHVKKRKKPLIIENPNVLGD